MAASTPFIKRTAGDVPGHPVAEEIVATSTVVGARAGGSGEAGNAQGTGRRAESAADQSLAEPVPAAGLAALDRPDRPAEPAGGLLVGEPFEVAEDHGRR